MYHLTDQGICQMPMDFYKNSPLEDPSQYLVIMIENTALSIYYSDMVDLQGCNSGVVQKLCLMC